jgi:nucleoside phosphorylase/tetratricopeptide (TPR) repeat protein
MEQYLELPIAVYNKQADAVQEALLEWGRDTFTALFESGGIAQNWYFNARSIGLSKLCLEIVSDDASVMSWPWEVLESSTDGPLALQCRMERRVENKIGDTLPMPNLTQSSQLNILYVIARPYGDGDVCFQTLARPVIDFLNKGKWPVHIDVLRPPAFDQLRSVLEEKPGFYHIVHFDGHGGFGGSTGVLVFENENHKPDEIPANRLGQLLRKDRIPVIVLNACQSAMMSDDPFASVAVSLLQSGIHNVVAMSYSLWVKGAEAFIPAFYTRLLKSGDISSAMQYGREEMYRKQSRDTYYGEVTFQDWIVPVLYESDTVEMPKLKPGDERESALPNEVRSLGDYGFIGRDSAIQNLERAMHLTPAGILIHGMAGEGKTTLAKGFLHWLEATNGLGNGTFWFSFEDIHSAGYVIDTLVGALFGTQGMALQDDQKLTLLIKALKETRYIIVWDNFESASDIPGTEVSALIPEQDRVLLKDFLHKLRGGQTKVLITSRSPEKWMPKTDCFRLPLEGLQGDELWQYCNAVVRDFDLSIDRKNPTYKELLDKLYGNPLAIRAILLRLDKTPAKVLLRELDDEFNAVDGNEDVRRIQSALGVFGKGLDHAFAPVLRLLGLHEFYADTDYIWYMLKSDNLETIGKCFASLEQAGLCHSIGNNIYRLHPALCASLARIHPALESDKRAFVDIMSNLADEYTPKEVHEQRAVFALYSANFRYALKLARELDMRLYMFSLLQGLATYALNTRDLYEAELIYTQLSDVAKSFGYSKVEASTYHQLGIIAYKRHDFDTAEIWYKKALEIELKLGDEHGAASTYHQLGIVAQERRDFDAAETWYKKSLEIELKQGDEHGAAPMFHQLGMIAEARRDFNVAESLYNKSLEIALKQGNEHGAAVTYHQLGMVAQERRDFDTAETWYKKSLHIELKLGDEHGAASTYHQLGMVAQERRDFESADSWYKRSLEIKLKTSDEYGVASTYRQLGNIAAECRDFDTAETWFKKALDIFQKFNDPYSATGIYRNLGVLAAERRDFSAAEEWYKRSFGDTVEMFSNAKIYVQSNRGSQLLKEDVAFLGWEKVSDLIESSDTETLESLDLNLLTDSPETALGYLKSVDNAPQTRCGAKVILMGDGGAGKTSLAHLWSTGKPIDDPHSTNGILIHEATIELSSESCHLRIWDFGGQHIYRPFHTLFLSDYKFCEKVICVIVLDAWKEEYPDEWLHYIDTFARNSHVLLVLNKIDERPRASLDIAHYIERYDNLYNEVFKLSCRYPESCEKNIMFFFGTVETMLSDSISDYKTRYNETWFKIWDEIESWCRVSNKYMSNERFVEVCESHGVPKNQEDLRKSILDTMNRQGIVLTLSDNARHPYIFNPCWVADGLYKIIDANVDIESGFKVSFDALKAALQKKDAIGKQDERYDSEEDVNVLLGVLINYGICMQVSGNREQHGEHYFIPALLSASRPSEVPETTDWLTFLYEFEFLPPSVLHRLMVKFWRELVRHKPIAVWCYGVLLDFSDEENLNNNNTVFIESDRSSIRIHVSQSETSQVRYLFMQVCGELDRIIASSNLRDYTVTKKIKLFVQKDEYFDRGFEYFNLDTLRTLLKRNRKTFCLPQSLHEINVSEELCRYIWIEQEKREEDKDMKTNANCNDRAHIINVDAQNVNGIIASQTTQDNHSRTNKGILIAVATPLELKIALEQFREAGKTELKMDIQLSYSEVVINNRPVFIVQSQMGSGGVGGATLTFSSAIERLKPEHAIMGGIAYGADKRKQSIGDVLLSRQIWGYESRKIMKTREIKRGDKLSASPQLVQLFETFQTTNLGAIGHHCFSGLIVSGEKLVDNEEFMEKLRNEEPEMIGGDMEVAGFAAACYRKSVPWIMVKGICDWGYDKQTASKDDDQVRAATNSFRIIRDVIMQLR